MCGIVGYVGKKECKDILIEGLKRLEYRGYDSVGIATIMPDGHINMVKKKGRVATIEGVSDSLLGTCGIGHTRWATHGRPSDINSHPHTADGFAVVHNGIIENFLELKIELVNEGVRFSSDTDTEVVAHLLKKYDKGNFIQTVRDTVKRLKGSYALCILSSDYPDTIAVAKKDNPLIIGKCEQENYIASDIPAISQYTHQVYVLKDNEMALVTKDNVTFYNDQLEVVSRELERVESKAGSLDKGLYESFMLKEIHEIPLAIMNTVEYLQSFTRTESFCSALKNTKSVTAIGCGTAYHAAMAGRYMIESVARVPVIVEIASEYRYRDPIVVKGDMVVAVSQSGETADTIAAIRLAKERGAYIVVITNIASSSLTQLADTTILLQAGPEIAVAATKSYNCQLLGFYQLGIWLAQAKEMADTAWIESEMQKLSGYALQLWESTEKLINFAGQFSGAHSVFFLGRGLDYAVALEGSLKLKEISYIHSEGYPSGELKHGTLALIEEGTLVVILMTQRRLAEKTQNALHEVKARGATVLVVSQFEDICSGDGVDLSLKLPTSIDILMPVLEVVPLQMFAYYMARAKGNDPDKPRNLAKSVTVE